MLVIAAVLGKTGERLPGEGGRRLGGKEETLSRYNQSKRKGGDLIDHALLLLV